MIKAVWLKFDHDWGWNLSRLLAYTCIMGLFSVLGLELLLLSIFLRLVSPATESNVVHAIVRLLPDRVTADAVIAFGNSIEQAPLIVLILGLPVTLWYGTRFFVVIETCLCVIFRRQQRSFVQQNQVALLMLLLFAVALPAIVLSATFTPFGGLGLGHATISHSRLANEPLVSALTMLTSLALNFLILLTFYSVLTPGGVSMRHAWLGALLGAVLAQGYILIFPLYTRAVLQPQHFGTIAGFVFVVLVFFYAYSIFVICGAELASWRAGYRAAPLSITDTLAKAYPGIIIPIRPARRKPATRPATASAVNATAASGPLVLPEMLKPDEPIDLLAD